MQTRNGDQPVCVRVGEDKYAGGEGREEAARQGDERGGGDESMARWVYTTSRGEGGGRWEGWRGW